MVKRKATPSVPVRKEVEYLISLQGGVLRVEQFKGLLRFKENHIVLSVRDDGSVVVSYPDERLAERFCPKSVRSVDITTISVDFGITVADIKLLIS